MDFLALKNFIPHGYCLNWNLSLLWLHVISDVLIGLAYFSIPLSLMHFVKRRKDLPYPKLFFMFSFFILACGTTHFLSAIMIWWPLYWLDGSVKAVTAVVSILAAILTFKIIPHALRLPSTEQLHAEIAQRQQVEEELRLSEYKYRMLYDNTSDALILLDEHGFIDCNPASLAMFGYKDKSLFLTRHPADFSPIKQADEQDSVILANQYIAQALATGYQHFEWLHKRFDTGFIFLTEVSLNTINIDGKWLILGTIRNIEHRKQAEETLKRNEAQFRMLIESLNVGVTLHDTNGKVILHNPSAVELLGLNDVQLLGKSPYDPEWQIFYEDGSRFPIDELPVPQAIKTRKAVQNVIVNVSRPAKNDNVWLLVSAVPQLNTDGSVLQVICSFSDISKSKEAEQRLQQSETRLLLSQQYGGIGSWEADLIHNKQIWSKTAYQLIGNPSISEPTWQDFLALIYPEDRQRVINANQAHLNQGTKYDVEYRIHSSNDMIHWMRSAGRAEFAEDGTPTRFVGIVQDITERKLMEAELKRSNADLEQFAYAISHDLRQPLRMVSSYLSLLRQSLDQQLDEEQQQFLSFALDGAKRMDAMILSLLDYSRVGHRDNAITKVSSRVVLNEVLTFLEPERLEKAGTIEVTGEWVEVMLNPDELTSLLQNLISNALKYHDVDQIPYINIHASVHGNLFKVSIRDHGIGIDNQQIERLFKVFSRLHVRSRFEGTGIGLALCRKIVEHYGGRIDVESAGEGQGSVFWFELPISQPIVETVA